MSYIQVSGMARLPILFSVFFFRCFFFLLLLFVSFSFSFRPTAEDDTPFLSRQVPEEPEAKVGSNAEPSPLPSPLPSVVPERGNEGSKDPAMAASPYHDLIPMLPQIPGFYGWPVDRSANSEESQQLFSGYPFAGVAIGLVVGVQITLLLVCIFNIHSKAEDGIIVAPSLGELADIISLASNMTSMKIGK